MATTDPTDRGAQPTRRVLPIEAALRWAYRDELPKARPDGGANVGRLANAWDSVTRFGLYLAEIDVNPFGVLHDPAALGPPHRDAQAIARAVDELATLVLEMPDDWHPFRDLGDLGEAGEAARVRALDRVSIVSRDAGGGAVRQMRAEPRRLVIANAINPRAPDHTIERPVLRFVTGARGGKPKWFRRELRWVEEHGRQVQREIEIDGYDQKAQRPKPDAYRKTYLDPDPIDGAIWRAEWQVWVTALDLLAIELDGVLDTIDVRPTRLPLAPWEDPEALGRVLPDLGQVPLRPMTLARGQWGNPATVARDVRKTHRGR